MTPPLASLDSDLRLDCLPRLREAVEQSQARYLEIRIERNDITRIHYQGEFLKECGSSRDCGGMVRALGPAGWGVATFNDLDRLEDGVRAAQEHAHQVTGERIELADVDPVQASHTPEWGEDFRAVSLERKLDLISGYNQILMGQDPRIRDSRAFYQDQVREVCLVNSEGTVISRQSSLLDLSLVAIILQGGVPQQGKAMDAYQDVGFEAACGKESWGVDAARHAVGNLEAAPVPGGVYTVICDPELTGLFTHEAFGHLSEADHQFQNPELQEAMRPGRMFGREILNIYDSGVESPELLGTIPVDDEGTPARRTELITAGRLVGRLHSRETAARMGEEPTGNARAQDYSFAPIVRMRNTAIARGETSFDEMLADVEHGVYACGGVGGQTNLGNFSFSATHGFMIRNGKIGQRVRDVILAGNIFQTLASIDAVGDDPAWICAGRCGKDGQRMPVGLGGPHVRIQDVVIGGA